MLTLLPRNSWNSRINGVELEDKCVELEDKCVELENECVELEDECVELEVVDDAWELFSTTFALRRAAISLVLASTRKSKCCTNHEH